MKCEKCNHNVVWVVGENQVKHIKNSEVTVACYSKGCNCSYVDDEYFEGKY